MRIRMEEKFAQALRWAASQQVKHFSRGAQAEAIRSVWALLDGLPINTVLEVGSGRTPSPMTEMLAEHGIECVGLDLLGDTERTGDAHDLPFADKSFDAVISRHCLEHVLCPYMALQEMARVTRQYIVVVVPADSPRAEESPGHLWLLSERGYRLIFNRLGLKEVTLIERDISEDRPQLEWQWLLMTE